jgi:hypothetical protein
MRAGEVILRGGEGEGRRKEGRETETEIERREEVWQW